VEDKFYPIGDLNTPIWQWGERKPEFNGQRTLMNKKVMYKNLLDFKESCDKYNLTFVIIFGALLGIIRDGDLIEKDTDIDVMCFTEAPDWKDYYKFGYVIEDMEKKGFLVTDRKFCPWHDIGFVRGGEKIEIWMFTEIDDEKIYDQVVRFPKHFFYPLEEREFLGTKFKVPNCPETFLAYTYGDTWNIPNPKGAYILSRYHQYKEEI